MLLPLGFLILTLLAIDLAPAPVHNDGMMSLLISSIPFAFIAMIQKRWLKRPILDKLLFSELFLFTLLFFYGIGFPHTFWTIALFLSVCFLIIGIGLSWHTTLFLLPFSLPFLLFLATSNWLSPLIREEIFITFTVLLFITVLLFLPLAFQWIWRCKPLPHSSLKNRLDSLCMRIHFRHGGLLIWKTMHTMSTAAIIGIFPRFRYILFTEPLLHSLSEDELEAVLAHEIGHSFHKHLLIYPFLFLGLLAVGTLASPIAAQISPLFAYFLFAVLLFLYIRFVIGFFSRHFERQADLHVFALGLPATSLINAFHRISLPLKKRNWHHGSLADRIAFLQKAEATPNLIKQHHLKVRYCLIGYLLINLAFWICWILIN